MIKLNNKLNKNGSIDLSTRGMKGTPSFCLLTGSGSRWWNKSSLVASAGFNALSLGRISPARGLVTKATAVNFGGYNKKQIELRSRYFSTPSINSTGNQYIQGCYKILNDILNNKPFRPHLTQLESETALFDYIEKWVEMYGTNGVIDYGMGNDVNRKWLISYRLKLIQSLKNMSKNRMKDLIEGTELQDLMDKYNKKSSNKFSKKLMDVRLAYILKLVGPEQVANLLISIFITVISNKDNPEVCIQLQLNIKLGKRLFNIVLKKLYLIYKQSREGGNYLGFNTWVIENKDCLVKLFDVDSINVNTYTASCGGVLIELLLDHDILTSYLDGITKSKTTYILGVNSKVLSQLGDDIKTFKPTPLYLPMVEEPKKYTFNSLGGYLLNDSEYRKTVIINKPHFKHKSQINSESMYNMINGVSSTPFCINKVVLDYLNEYGRMNNLLLLDPRAGLSDDAILRLKSKKNKSDYREFLSSFSKYDLESHILNIANIYRNYDKLYFPIRLDVRGRIYCTPLYLNYQGSELAKALLLFSDKSKLYLNDDSSLEYFYSYGANCYGNGVDKQSRVKKVEWVKDNHENIMNFKNNTLLLSKANNKFLFIAFALEYIKIQNVIKEEKDSFVYTQLPIQLDATCNGYQHLSMLSRDNDLGKNLNLMSSKKEDVPKDFYGLLINKITQTLTNLYKSDTEVDSVKLEGYKRIIDFKPDRSLIKKSVMIESYNATLIKSADSLKASCYCINEPDFGQEDIYDPEKRMEEYKKRMYVRNNKSDYSQYLMEDDFLLIVTAMKDVLKNDYPKLAKLRLYLSEVGQICNKLSLTIPWTLPSGLRVDQSYLTDKKVQIKPFDGNKKSFTVRHIDKDNLDKNKQIRALMPNLIHSLDAASLTALYNKYISVNKSIFTVHDCYAVPIPFVETLIELLQSVYLDIYSDKEYLKIFDKCIIDHMKLSLGNQIKFVDNKDNPTKAKYIIYNDKEYKYPDVDLLFKDVSDFDVIFDAMKNKKAIYTII